MIDLNINKGCFMNRRVLVKLAGLIVTTFSLSSYAENYEPVASASSAFVRVFSEMAEKSEDVFLGGKKVPISRASGLSPYILLEEGIHKVGGLNGLKTVSVQAKKYYTVLNISDGVRLVEDEPLKRKTKAMVRLYNLGTGSQISLKTESGKVTLLKTVPAGETAKRLTNSATLTLAIFKNKELLKKTGVVSLKRGEITNIFFSDHHNELSIDVSRVNTRL